jgi:hypothetical protein
VKQKYFLIITLQFAETTGEAPMPMIQGIATKILLFNLAACLQNWVKNNLQF